MGARILHDWYGHPSYWCPVCNRPHSVAVHEPFSNGAKWAFNGDYDNPTFTPSVHTYAPEHSHEFYILKRNGVKYTNEGESKPRTWWDQEQAEAFRDNELKQGDWVPCRRVLSRPQRTYCHVHIKDGDIQILNDSQKMGGQTLPLQPWDPEEYGKTGKRVPE